MSFFRSFYGKFFLLIGVFLLSALTFAGCQQQVGRPSALVTPKGIRAESFLPVNTFMVLQWGASNRDQGNLFSALLKHFPQDDQEKLNKSIVDGFDKDLSKYSLSYQKDLEPALGKEIHGMIAVEILPTSQQSVDVQTSVPQASSQAYLSDPIVSSPSGESSGVVGDPPSDMNGYGFLALHDPSKMDELLQSLVKGGFFKTEQYNGSPVYFKESTKQYMVRVEDLLVVTTTFENLKAAIDRYQSGQGSFIQDEGYQNALKSLRPSFAFAYLNVKAMNEVLLQMPDSQEKLKKMYEQFPSLRNTLDAFQGEVFALHAEDKGIRLTGAVYGDASKMKLLEQNFESTPPHELYLYKKVPGNGLIMYMEMYSLKKRLEYSFKVWGALDGFTDGFNKVKAAFTQAGIDFDKDFMPLFDKGLAVSMQNNGSFVPSLGVYVDVTDHLDSANKAMIQLKNLVDMLIQEADARLQDNPGVLTNEEVPFQSGKAHVLRLHLARLSAKNRSLAMMQLFLVKPVEVWYGVTDDHMAFITLYPEFDTELKGNLHVENDPNFKEALGHIERPDRDVIYMSPSEYISYAGKFIDIIKMAANLSASQGAAAQQSFDKIKQYFLPFGGMIFTSHSVSEGEARIEGFITIKKL